MPKDGEEPQSAGAAKGSRVLGYLRHVTARLTRWTLPGKLLLLTILFVMLAEVLIFVPSISNFRVNWLNDRLLAARLAALATEDRQDAVSDMLRTELLMLAQVKAVSIKRQDRRGQILRPEGPLTVDAMYDLRHRQGAGLLADVGFRAGLIRDALAVFVARPGRTIMVTGRPELPMTKELSEDDYVEIIMPEAALRSAMTTYGLNILALSIVISLIAAALLYAVLTRLLVKPILRIADAMVAFSAKPEDTGRIVTPSGRADEIGIAERELERMQRDIARLLHSQKRLAALGLAVAKISHDLRNMLSSVQLFSDRLASVRDPIVQRFAPKLMASLDRAIALCNDTIRYGRAEEAPPARETFVLASLAAEVGDGLALPRAGLDWRLDVDPTLTIDADRAQMFRLLNNMVRNSVHVLERTPVPAEAGAPAAMSHVISLTARRADGRVIMIVRDSGPGLGAKAKANLFKAFQGGATAGGSGLGLAIAAEIVAAHGGTIRLLEGETGAAFEVVIPDRADQGQ